MRSSSIQGPGGPIPVSKIVLGTTYFGTDIPDSQAMEMMDVYYEHGGRTIDTARMYGQRDAEQESLSERVVGRWLRESGHREGCTLITKCAHPPLNQPDRHRLDAVSLRRDIEDSLGCTGLDYIDVLCLHRDHEDVPVEGIMDTLHEFVAEGKVRAVGASNWRLERILEANAYAEKTGKTPFSVSEIQWSLAICDQHSWGDDTLVYMHDEEYDRYRKAGVPILAFAAQGKGIFSKYLAGGEAAITPKARRFLRPENIRRAERVGELAARTGLSPAAICLGYIASNPVEAFAIVGCSNIDQLRDSLSAADVCFDAETLAFLEAR